MLLVICLQPERATYIYIEMNQSWHCAEITRYVAIYGIWSQWPEACLHRIADRRRSIGRAVIEYSVTVVIGPGGYVVGNAIVDVHLGVKLQFERQEQVPEETKIVVAVPIDPGQLASSGICRLRAVDRWTAVRFHILIFVVRGESEALIAVLTYGRYRNDAAAPSVVVVLHEIGVRDQGAGREECRVGIRRTPYVIGHHWGVYISDPD